ncbi:golgin subfamily A member 6B-like [Choloepus didactylus]|uniref:golgin subfamily A member 6B-like n=1 Tax=Choloepus didactylus TaxID=27675 RepID=UPI0018A0E104|nr:golgin subfamily A member 6B-like [Choloepus didactylus]
MVTVTIALELSPWSRLAGSVTHRRGSERKRFCSGCPDPGVVAPPPLPFPRCRRKPDGASWLRPKKMLREFQQKDGTGVPAGAKKKRKIKNGSSPKKPTSGGPLPKDPQGEAKLMQTATCHQALPLEFLKVLVSDLHRSNGVTLPHWTSGS